MIEGGISLRSEVLQAVIDPMGAQLSELRDAEGRQLLWHGDPAWWSGRAPILFPIVGALKDGVYRWQGKPHSLPRHGFARGKRFEVVHARADATLLRLRADDATRAVYPFEFELDLDFRLADDTLTVTAIARNAGSGPMPASLGFHPAFRWPLPDAGARESHRLVFAEEEPAPVRRLDASGLLLRDPEPSPARGRILSLDDRLFLRDVLIFDRLGSRSLVFAGTGGAAIEVGFPDATYLGVWTKPGAPFLCIEPWRGVADPQGFDGELADKPGLELLERPGDCVALTMMLKVVP